MKKWTYTFRGLNNKLVTQKILTSSDMDQVEIFGYYLASMLSIAEGTPLFFVSVQYDSGNFICVPQLNAEQLATFEIVKR